MGDTYTVLTVTGTAPFLVTRLGTAEREAAVIAECAELPIAEAIAALLTTTGSTL